MNKYKYKVGQKIKYKTQKYFSAFCPTCGHEETDSKTIKVEGKIMKRYYDIVFRFQSMVLTDKITKNKDGSTTNNPYLSDIKINKEEPVYEVVRDGQRRYKKIEELATEIVTEDEIIKITN